MKQINYRAGTHTEDILPGNIRETLIDGAQYNVSGYLHQAGFVRLSNNDILIGCGGIKIPGAAGGDYGKCWCYLWRSQDNGETFEEVPTPFADNAVSDRMLSNPTFVQLDDRLIMLARSASDNPADSDTYQIFSFDHGRTWGSLFSGGKDWEWQQITRFDRKTMDCVPPTGDRGFNLWGPCHYTSRPKVLRNGTILFTLAASWGEYDISTTRGGSYVFASVDKGVSWQYRGMMPRPVTAEVICEPAIQELPDGKLIALVRSYNSNYQDPGQSRPTQFFPHCPDPADDRAAGITRIASRYFYWITSEDEGFTWSEPWPSYIPSERWNGSLPDIALQGDYLYLLGNFSQYQPDRFPGSGAFWQAGTQRSVLSLLRIPLREIDKMFEPGTARIPSVEASRPLGINPAADYRLTGTYASVQLEAMPDGSLCALSDTHTRAWDRNVISFLQFDPGEFFRHRDTLWLHRGPLPLIHRNGEIELFDTQTTLKPQYFPQDAERWELAFELKIRHLICNRQYLHPVFTVWNNAELQTINLPYPKSIFAAIEIQVVLPKDGGCRLIAHTANGIADTGVALVFDRRYSLQLAKVSDFRWSLTVNGQPCGVYDAVTPGRPGTFSLAHESFPAAAGNLVFDHVCCRFEPAAETAMPIHPFYLKQLSAGQHWLDQTMQNYLCYGGMTVCYNPAAELRIAVGNVWLITADNGQLSVNGQNTGLAADGAFGIGGAALQDRVYIVNRTQSKQLKLHQFLYPQPQGVLLQANESVICIKLIGCDAHPSALRRLLTPNQEK